ncbi:MAG: cytochrome c family protein [Thermoguttaceae bacterium]
MGILISARTTHGATARCRRALIRPSILLSVLVALVAGCFSAKEPAPATTQPAASAAKSDSAAPAGGKLVTSTTVPLAVAPASKPAAAKVAAARASSAVEALPVLPHAARRTPRVPASTQDPLAVSATASAAAGEPAVLPSTDAALKPLAPAPRVLANQDVLPNPLREAAEPADDGAPEAKAPPAKSAPARGPTKSKPAAVEPPPEPPASKTEPPTGAEPGPTIKITPKVEPLPKAEVVPKADGNEKSIANLPKHSTIPFDPIKENGPIFVNWQKPRLALVFTGREEGYLEPCGCAGLDRMKGGMSRRYTMFKTLATQGWPSGADPGTHSPANMPQTLANQGWPLVGLDVGGISKGFGRQAELKFQTAINGIRKINGIAGAGYAAINLGATDLQLPAAELLAAVGGQKKADSLYVSVNAALFGFAADFTPQARVVQAGGLRLGITAVLGKKYQQLIRNPDVEMLDPPAVLAKVVPQLKMAKVDHLILLAYASEEETNSIAARFPDFDFIVTSAGGAEPPNQPTLLKNGKTRLIEVGEKGMNAVVIGLFDDPKKPLRYQRVPLDSRWAPARPMKDLMRAYEDQLKDLGLAGLGIRAVPYPQKDLRGGFVGTEKCKSCHEASYQVWKKTPHSTAYASLKNADPFRNYDPECISCHVVGWNPSKFFPYDTGYQSELKTPHLVNVGCEDCHGPGENHVAAEMGANRALQVKLQKEMAISKEEAADPTSRKQNCFNCHDLDNSPDFKFNLYFPVIEHHEK